MPSPPYELARLVNGDKPLSHRWYVVFWVWDKVKEKKIRKRDYDVNKFDTKAKRIDFAKKLCKDINSKLVAGYVFNPKAKKQQEVKAAANHHDYSIREAFKYILPVIKATKRIDTYNSYHSIARLFVEFCDTVGWADWKLKTLSKTDIIAWLDYSQAAKEDRVGNTNTTRNKYHSFLSAMLGMMVERGYLEKNPALGIKMLAEDKGGNTAYTPGQVEELKAAINEADPRLWLFISFMVYGFIRPAEIGRLRVNMIDLNKNIITLPGSITKNRKTRFCIISAAWRTYINELNLTAYRPDHYIFGKNLVTGSYGIQKNYASTQHLKIVRDLDYMAGYTLYSWKHTGVILHYRAGVDIKSLQAQLGHQSLEETDVYLKSLNLYENTEIQDKSPVI